MALSKIQAESMNLADTYAFTGTVSGAGETNDMKLISTTNITTAVSSVDFETLSTDYNHFVVHFADVEPSNNGESFAVRIKTSGSGGYATSNYDFSRQRIYKSGASTWTDSANGYTGGTANITLGVNNYGTGYSEATTSGFVYFHNVHSTNKRKGFTSQSYGGTDNQNTHAQNAGCTYVGTGSLNPLTGIRMLFGSGNIANGRISLYGLKT